MRTCVACGELYEGQNHHCNPIRENAIEASRRASNEFRGYTRLSEAQRLNMGLEMLYDPYNDEDKECQD